MSRPPRPSGRGGESVRTHLETLFGEGAGAPRAGASWRSEVHVGRGPVERLGALANVEAFSDFRRWVSDDTLDLAATLRAGRRARRVPVDGLQAAALYDVGATIIFNGVDRRSAVLARWVRALSRDLGAVASLGHCNVYLSPRGEAVARHSDAHAVVVVQVIGSKTWSLARDRRVTLRAGSAIFVPAGTPHATRALEPSLSLTFGVRDADADADAVPGDPSPRRSAPQRRRAAARAPRGLDE